MQIPLVAGCDHREQGLSIRWTPSAVTNGVNGGRVRSGQHLMSDAPPRWIRFRVAGVPSFLIAPSLSTSCASGQARLRAVVAHWVRAAISDEDRVRVGTRGVYRRIQVVFDFVRRREISLDRQGDCCDTSVLARGGHPR